MIKIGLTGGIASGKSLVSGFFEDEGIIVLDADKIYKNLLKTNELLYNEIKNAFNLKDLDLTILANIVFNNQDKIKLLNSIAHPYVKEEYIKLLKEYERSEKLVVLDIPLLYEAKMESYCDLIICVYIDEEIQIERLIERDSFSVEDAQKRIASQMSLSEKCKISDYVIDNSKSREFSYYQFKKILNLIKEKIDVN
ncbi:MAG: dephospho-CoA kinase [Candidatus Izemoplasmatales bacterium]|nr:dephospho-CoA kinase [Candidatus Izemoplasmatales bacterium]MDD4068934.1 dephospho-CoA kinase [Candidatus Izemoplasmatales bacterium]